MKTRLGSDVGKKYSHVLDKTVYTTSQFGFCQPICCRELTAQSHIKVRTASQVYLQPVAKPTFGRLMIKQYKTFVPIEEVWHAYGSFMAKKPYSGAINEYIPSQVPSVSLDFLMTLTYLCSEVCGISAPNAQIISYAIGSLDENSDKLTQSEVIAGVQYWLDNVLQNGKFQIDAESLFELATNYGLLQVKSNGETGDLAFSPESADWYVYIDSPRPSVLLGRFTERGKNLRKVLIGLGYQITQSQSLVTILPIISYYKAWFDLFAIQREMTWKQTNAFSIIEYVEQSGNPLGYNSSQLTKLLNFFWLDLPECYFTQSPDFAAAHISGLGIGAAENRTYYENTLTGGIDQTAVIKREDAQPIIPNSGALSQQSLDILKALYKRANKATAIGGRIKEFMRSVFGSDYGQDDYSNYIGSTSSVVDISQVMSTAETSEGFLGEYAGKGVGSSVGDTFDFMTRLPGYYIEFFCLVPDTRLAQAVDPNLFHVVKEDFFDPAFDALTLLPTRKSAIYGVSSYSNINYTNQYDTGFGNIPNYTEYKVSFDTINGDMSMPSTLASFLPFSLAKLLPYTQVKRDSAHNTIFNIENVNPSLITSGDIWRYIGRDKWLGNFDRIFVNEGVQVDAQQGRLNYRLDDNFVCFFYCDFKMQSFELPLSHSFQTDAFDVNGMDVEKA